MNQRKKRPKILTSWANASFAASGAFASLKAVAMVRIATA
jgi:hypothetical protein